jgi:hypothetical protein
MASLIPLPHNWRHRVRIACLAFLVEAGRLPGHLRARTSWLMRLNPNFAAPGRHPELTFSVACCASNYLGGTLSDVLDYPAPEGRTPSNDRRLPYPLARVSVSVGPGHARVVS